MFKERDYNVSIVVPVFNGERFLHDCLDSLLRQTYTGHVEIVIVDDGSSDDSGLIIEEYLGLNSNIKFVRQKNSGVTSAREKGVNAASGEWITFVDADDTMPQDSLKLLFGAINRDTDIVIGGVSSGVKSRRLNLYDCRKAMIKGNGLPPALWGKLFRKELFNSFVFDIPRQIKKGEDQLMNIRLLFQTEKNPILIDSCVYNYRANPLSVSHNFKANLEYEALYDIYREQSIPDNFKDKYAEDIISIKINGLIGPAYLEPQKLCCKNNAYLQHLKEQISQHSYSLSFQEWILLNTPFAWMYKCVSFIIMLKNSIRYRLGLNN